MFLLPAFGTDWVLLASGRGFQACLSNGLLVPFASGRGFQAFVSNARVPPLASGRESEPFLVNFRVFIFCSSSLRSPLAAFVEVVAVIAIAYRSHWPLAYVECVLSQSRFRSPLATEGCFHWCRTMDNPLACVFSQCVCALCFSPVKLLEKMYWKTSSRFPTYSIIFAGP